MRPGYRIACLTLLLAAVAGCGAPAPGASYELAVQGAYAAALSRASELALIGSINHGGSLWRTEGPARLFDWNHRTDAYSSLVAAAFSPDGTRAVTVDPRTLVIWDTATGASIAYWATPGTALDVAITSDGRVLVGLADHSAVLFDGGSGRHLQTLLHDEPVVSVNLSADGRWALTGSEDATAVLWDTVAGARVHTFSHDAPVAATALSPSGRYAFSASRSGAAAVWSGADGRPVFELPVSSAIATSARFSADEARLLVGRADGTVTLWDVGQGRRVAAWRTGRSQHWRPRRAAVLAVGFGTEPGVVRAVAGDGRLVTLHRS